MEGAERAEAQGSSLSREAVRQAVARLAGHNGHGAAYKERVRRGVEQAALRWWAEDGDERDFAAFCEQSFVASEADLGAVFTRLERVMEQVDGHVHEARRELTGPLDLDLGPLSPLDRLLAEVDLAPHVNEDLFRSKVAFLALLNFPVHRLADRLREGAGWSREEWARSRMMDRFANRLPADVALVETRAFIRAEHYVGGYNLRLDRLVDEDGGRLFPEGLRLITHWGLRDELSSNYTESDPGRAFARQRAILKVMERIVRQQIPAAVVDNPDLLWNPRTNQVWQLGGGLASPREQEREPDSRYARLLEIFQAERLIDPFSPGEPSFLARRFDRDRQIPESEVEALLVSVLESPEAADLARLISRRLGRPLEPFDIWYSGFKSRARHGEAELDRAVCDRYPDVTAFQAGLPDLLGRLGFAQETARWLAERVVVDAARGAGHALGAERRGDRAHLRTRLPRGGMNYKGYNVALHEMGHNIEQVFSLEGIDHWWLHGVPNNAFTEAFAFVFQNRDLELLGLAPPGDEARAAEALGTLWNTFEIAGVSLVDMRVWHWLYDHPAATPAELREATLGIAREVWDRYFSPLFGAATRGSEILSIYSHMIAYGLYLPDYAIGHILAFQVAERLRGEVFGREFERMARIGRLTPDAWMRSAVGGPISAHALLASARSALTRSAD